MRDDTIHKAQSNIKDGDILLTYWGVHHNWDKHNALVFNGNHVVEHIRKSSYL